MGFIFLVKHKMTVYGSKIFIFHKVLLIQHEKVVTNLNKYT